jgi:hypothetical protein
MTLSIMGFVVTLSINYIQHNDTQPTSIECSYAECRDYLNVMLIVIMLNIVILSVVAPLLDLSRQMLGLQLRPEPPPSTVGSNLSCQH